jgi:uncharacterized membrane protein YgdD (TMEM256/DUF423 family)
MDKMFAMSGAISALIGVAAGAFGAHALKDRLSDDMLAVFEVGVKYQMYHAFGLLAVAWALSRWPEGVSPLAGWFFILGTVLFSGSLYALSLSGIRWLGAITPLGGLAFILGWAMLAWGIYRT